MKKITKAIAAIMLITTVFVYVGCNKQGDSDVRVTTYTPQDITQTSAVCGGDVIVTQGLSLNELGVCWSTSSKPTVEDSHLSTSNWNEPYVCTIMGLETGKTYHVRAYALRGLEYYYGEDKSFTTESNGGSGGGNGGNGINSHEYVDLGLPSGTLWATCNVGATTPEDYGDYFAWGETQPKGTYDWSTYQYCMGSNNTLTKYCNKASHGYNGYTDNLTKLMPGDDAATVNWGSGWRMPTKEQWWELYQSTTNTWATQNGVKGRLFAASNGNSIFLPAAGYRWGDELYLVGLHGSYWLSSLYINYPNYAWDFGFNSDYSADGSYYRSVGRSVRAVRSTTKK